MSTVLPPAEDPEFDTLSESRVAREAKGGLRERNDKHAIAAATPSGSERSCARFAAMSSGHESLQHAIAPNKRD